MTWNLRERGAERDESSILADLQAENSTLLNKFKGQQVLLLDQERR